MKNFRPRLPNDTNWRKILDYIKNNGSEKVKQLLEDAFEDIPNTSIQQEYGKVFSTSPIIKSIDDLKEAVDFDENKYQVTDGKHNSWGVSAKTNDGKHWIYNTNYQVILKWKMRGLEKPDLSYMKEWVKNMKEIPNLPDYEYKQDKKPIVVALGDLHVGAYFEGDGLHHDYNSEIAKDNLNKVVNYVNTFYPNRDVHYIIGGDLIETFTGKNHADMWKHIELHGAKAAFTAFQILYEMFMKTNNLKSVKLVGGNHDRISQANDDDKMSQVAELLYYFFDEFTNINMTYDDHHLSEMFDDVGYIISHGDKKFSNQKGSELILNYGFGDNYNVIIGFHKHKLEITEDTLKYRKITIPSIVNSTNHAKDMGLQSPSGFAIFESIDGYTLTQIVPLHEFK